LIRGDIFSPRMPCQWYVRGGGEGKRRILIGQSVPPTPFGMAFGRLKLSPQDSRPVVEFFIIGERFVVITMQLQSAILLSTMNEKSSFIQVPIVITKQLVLTKQLKLYFNNSSRIPTRGWEFHPRCKLCTYCICNNFLLKMFLQHEAWQHNLFKSAIHVVKMFSSATRFRLAKLTTLEVEIHISKLLQELN
jgi:hypothetical protein